MYLKTLTLRCFRNYESNSFAFHPSFNAIVGENGIGKTNLLEAIHLLITGRSFRTARMQELIRYSDSVFCVEANFIKHDVEQSMRIAFDGQQRRITINQTLCPSTTGMLGVVQGVLFSPHDQNLIIGAPSVRRQFLDIHLAQIDPLYVRHLMRYHRAMKQRNHLLRRKVVVTIESWEEEMALSGGYLAEKRAEAVEELAVRCREIYGLLSSTGAALVVKYKSQAAHQKEISAYFLEQYRKLRQREMDVGYTLTGIHKDDVTILLDGKEARSYASEGQQRLAAASLRLAEWGRLKEIAEDPPIMLVDDVGIGLDHIHRERLIEFLRTMKQVMISSPDPTLFDGENRQVFNLSESLPQKV